MNQAMKNQVGNTKLGVMDVANVFLIFEQTFRANNEVLEIERFSPALKFKRLLEPDDVRIDFKKQVLYLPDNLGEYSLDLFERAKKIINLLHQNSEAEWIGFDFYACIDDKGAFQKNFPVVLLDGSYGMVLAPKLGPKN